MVEVIYVDNHLLILNKPSGMLTQPNESAEISLECWGKNWIKNYYNKLGNVFLVAVHRLDRPVSGLVLLARTSKALSRLNTAMRNQSFQKTYIALVEGVVSKNEATLEHQIKRDRFDLQIMTHPTAQTKKCLLKYELIRYFSNFSLLKIFLLTGRYHQIRMQLAAIGHSVVGDFQYGARSDSKHFFLHNRMLQFDHPITQESLCFTANFPSYWRSYSTVLFK